MIDCHGSVVLMQLEGISVLSIELLILVIAIISIVWSLKLKHNWGKYHEEIN